jgi:hypothetical protein
VLMKVRQWQTGRWAWRRHHPAGAAVDSALHHNHPSGDLPELRSFLLYGTICLSKGEEGLSFAFLRRAQASWRHQSPISFSGFLV